MDLSTSQLHPVTLRFLDRAVEDVYRVDRFERSLSQIRIGLGVGCVMYAAFGILDIWIIRDVVTQAWIIRAFACGVIALGLALSWTPSFRQHDQNITMSVGLIASLGIIAMIVLADSERGDTYYVGLILVIMWAVVLSGQGFVYATASSTLIVIMYAVTTLVLRDASLAVLISSAFFLLGTNIFLGIASYIIERYARRTFIQTRQIDAERAANERLLLNILPVDVASQLKAGRLTIADHFDEATVFFSDVCEFTPLAARMAPEEVVGLLNDIFGYLDGIAERLGVEKIKTVGDGYMAVAGVPTGRADHLVAVAEMALEVRAGLAHFNAERGLACQMRIGIHSGPLVAGIIGSRKFIYDLWGDTVNIASRMEEAGVPGEIQCTEPVAQALRDTYAFTERGVMDIKGKGPMRTFFLTGRLNTAEPSSHAASPAALVS